MSVNKKPKLELFRAKCDSLNIRNYGTKIVMTERIQKYYNANNLGVFDPESLISLPEIAIDTNTETCASQSNDGDEASTSSNSDMSNKSKNAFAQPTSILNISINEE